MDSIIIISMGQVGWYLVGWAMIFYGVEVGERFGSSLSLSNNLSISISWYGRVVNDWTVEQQRVGGLTFVGSWDTQ